MAVHVNFTLKQNRVKFFFIIKKMQSKSKQTNVLRLQWRAVDFSNIGKRRH